MESYEVSYFQDEERGDTRRKIYYYNIYGSDDRSQLDVTGQKTKWRQQ